MPLQMPLGHPPFQQPRTETTASAGEEFRSFPMQWANSQPPVMQNGLFFPSQPRYNRVIHVASRTYKPKLFCEWSDYTWSTFRK